MASRDFALLADEMGLGKTVQTIISLRILLTNNASERVLIVAPSSLTYNWENEFSIWAPRLVVRRVLGSAEDRKSCYRLPIQILIASYDQVRTDGIFISKHVSFGLVILDEAQRIKNKNSKVALGCRLLRRKKSWAISGTPFENSFDDLISIFLFLKPGLIESCMTPKEIHKSIQDCFLRRRKSDVIKELPPIIVQEITLEMQGLQKKAYTDLWENRKESILLHGHKLSEASMLALLTRLKQVCNFDVDSGESVKWEALKLILDDLVGQENKIVIFSQYVATLKFLSKKMNVIKHELFTGEIGGEDRESVLSRFKNKSGPRALLVSLKAGGVGLNINEASTVVLFDRWWNPAVEDQAIQRAHRLGRKSHLHVIKFLMKDTIEERIKMILNDKTVSFDLLINDAKNAIVPRLSRDDLRRLLGLSTLEIEGTAYETV